MSISDVKQKSESFTLMKAAPFKTQMNSHVFFDCSHFHMAID